MSDFYIETYTIILKHEMQTAESNIQLDDPLCIKYTVPRNSIGPYGGAILINEMMDRLKDALLKRYDGC